MSLVIEPAANPGLAAREVAETVHARFDELAEVAANYLRLRLSEPQFRLSASELARLKTSESLFGGPEAVVWADGTWMLRFTESVLDMAEPYGIGVLFEGSTPNAVEDLSSAEPA